MDLKLKPAILDCISSAHEKLKELARTKLFLLNSDSFGLDSQ